LLKKHRSVTISHANGKCAQEISGTAAIRISASARIPDAIFAAGSVTRKGTASRQVSVRLVSCPTHRRDIVRSPSFARADPDALRDSLFVTVSSSGPFARAIARSRTWFAPLLERPAVSGGGGSTLKRILAANISARKSQLGLLRNPRCRLQVLPCEHGNAWLPGTAA
jgi:hypothetical protein